jgi:hypothetical protein
VENIPGINATEKISAGILRIKNSTTDSEGLYECLLSYQWNNTLYNISETNKITIKRSSKPYLFCGVTKNIYAIIFLLTILLGLLFLGALGYAIYLIYHKKFRKIPSSKYENF